MSLDWDHSTALVFCRFIRTCEKPGKYHWYWKDANIPQGYRCWIPIHAAEKLIKDKFVKRVK